MCDLHGQGCNSQLAAITNAAKNKSYDSLLTLTSNALDCYSKTEILDKEDFVQCLFHHGEALFYTGRKNESLVFFDSTISLANELPNISEGEFRTYYFSYMDALQSTRNTDKIEKIMLGYLSSNRFPYSKKDSITIDIFFQLATIYWLDNKLQKASQFIEQGKDYAREQEATSSWAYTDLLLQEATILSETDPIAGEQQILQLIEHTNSQKHSSKDTRDNRLARIYSRLGGVYHSMNMYDESIYFYKKEYDLYTENNWQSKPQFGIVLNNLGMILTSRDRHEEGYPYLLQNYNMKYENLNGNLDHSILPAIVNLAYCGLISERLSFHQADSIFEIAHSIVKKAELNETKTDFNVSRSHFVMCLQANKYKEAFQIQNKIQKYLTKHYPKLSFEQLNSDILATGTLIFLDTNQATLELDTLKEKILLFQKTIYPSLTERQKLSFDQYFSKYVHQVCFNELNKPNPDIEKIFLAANFFSRNKSTVKSPAGSSVQQQLDSIINVFAHWSLKSNEQRDAAGVGSLDEMEIQIRILEKEIAQENSTEYNTEHLTIEKVQMSLSENDAYVQLVYLPFHNINRKDSSIFLALVIKKNATNLQILPEGVGLEGIKYDQYKDFCTDTVPSNSSIGIKIYQNFWAKIDAQLKGINRIFYQPDGVFHKITPSSFLDTNGSFLIDKYDFITISSPLSIIKYPTMQPKVSISRSAALFGNITYSTEKGIEKSKNTNKSDFDLVPLPQTQQEIESIMEILTKHGIQCDTFTHQRASENNIKNLSSPSILHISSHAVAYNHQLSKRSNKHKQGNEQESMLASQIFLADAQKTLNGDSNEHTEEDGILTALELSTIDLNSTELVVLSACNTGIGKLHITSGVWGLNTAAQMAGAKDVLFSLWPVPTHTTTDLMILFYENWLNKGMDKHSALRAAQLKIKEQYPQPVYWGAWVLVEN